MHYINPYIGSCLEGPSSIFKGLNQKEKEAIANHHSISRIKRGQYLFKEGEKARGLIFLASGKAKLYRTGVGGREQIIRMIKDQEMVGFQVIFTEIYWFASSVAIQDSVICILERPSLLRILRSNPDLSVKLNRILCEELSFSYNRLISLTQKHVRGRLAESLLMLAGIYGYEEDGRTINVYLSRDDIAHLSNMTTSNAIRTLANFNSEGIIKLKGKKISLLNPESLEQISEQA